MEQPGRAEESPETPASPQGSPVLADTLARAAGSPTIRRVRRKPHTPAAEAPATPLLVGLGTAVYGIVARPVAPPAPDQATFGTVSAQRGGMICNSLAVASALGIPTGGIIASGQDIPGRELRSILTGEGVQAAIIPTRKTPITITIVDGSVRTSILSQEGEREAQLDSRDVMYAWQRLDARPAWALLTLPAAVSEAGGRFITCAKQAGAKVAITLSRVDDVRENLNRLADIFRQADLLFGNSDEAYEVEGQSARPHVLIRTEGPAGARLIRDGRDRLHVPCTPTGADVIDTTGAGDAFAAGVLATLIRTTAHDTGTRSIPDDIYARALHSGNRAASAIIGQLGTTIEDGTRKLLEQVGAELTALKVR